MTESNDREISPDTGRIRAYYCTECDWGGIDESEHDSLACDETVFGMTWVDADQG